MFVFPNIELNHSLCDDANSRGSSFIFIFSNSQTRFRTVRMYVFICLWITFTMWFSCPARSSRVTFFSRIEKNPPESSKKTDAYGSRRDDDLIVSGGILPRSGTQTTAGCAQTVGIRAYVCLAASTAQRWPSRIDEFIFSTCNSRGSCGRTRTFKCFAHFYVKLTFLL